MKSILKFKECIHLPNESVYWGNEYRLINAIHYYYEQPFFSVRIQCKLPVFRMNSKEEATSVKSILSRIIKFDLFDNFRKTQIISSQKITQKIKPTRSRRKLN